MEEKYLMAIDAGTGSVRAVLFHTDGTQASCVQQEWEHKEDPRYPGSMDFDWVQNWKLACECIRGAVREAGILPEPYPPPVCGKGSFSMIKKEMRSGHAPTWTHAAMTKWES